MEASPGEVVEFQNLLGIEVDKYRQRIRARFNDTTNVVQMPTREVPFA
jgi:hypothetical protein